MKELRLRKCKIVQFLQNPKTKEMYITPERVDMICKNWKVIKRYAWILHDKDTYTKDSQEVIDKKKKVGDVKPPHIHIVLEFGENPIPIERIARKFGIKSNFIEQIFGGKFSFIECVEYLTHESKIEQENGKYRYDDKLINSNFEFRLEINNMNYKKTKYGNDEINIDILENRVFNGILTLEDIKEDYNEFLSKYYDRLSKARIHYVDTIPTPLTHINYYFGGKGGRIGKTMGALAFAYDLLYRYYGIDIYNKNFKLNHFVYIAEGKGVGMDAYDGQRIIIWDDYRPKDLLETYKSYGTFLKATDTSAGEIKTVRIKILYGKMKLVNSINMYCCPMSYNEFKNQFADECKKRKHNEKLDKDFVWLEPMEQLDGRIYFNNRFDMEKVRVEINKDLIKYNFVNNTDNKEKRFEMIPIAVIPNVFHKIYERIGKYDCNYGKATMELLDDMNSKLNSNMKVLTDKTLEKETNILKPELVESCSDIVKKAKKDLATYNLLLDNYNNYIICDKEIHTKDKDEFICSLEFFKEHEKQLQDDYFENKKVIENNDDLPF